MGMWRGVGAAPKQEPDDVEMAGGDGVMQHGRLKVGIVLRNIGGSEGRVRIQASSNAIAIAKVGMGENIDRRATSEEELRHRLPLAMPRGAIRTDLHQKRCEVAPPRLDVGTTVQQMRHHIQAAPIRGFPKHRATVRADPRDPVRPLAKHRPHRLQVAPTRSRHGNLEEVASFPRQE